MKTFLHWLLVIVPVIVVAPPAITKLIGAPGAEKLFSQLEMEPVGRILIGLIELLCVLLLLIPHFAIYGAILCLGVMVGAVIAHTTVLGFGGSMLGFFFSGLLAAVSCLGLIYLRRDQVALVRSMFET